MWVGVLSVSGGKFPLHLTAVPRILREGFYFARLVPVPAAAKEVAPQGEIL